MTTTFADAWNASYESIPADNENINLGANRIRDLKVAVHQRLAVDHSWSGDGNDGKHSQVTLQARSGVLALDATDAALWSQVVNGNQELFFQDSSSRLVQITTTGILNVPPNFPSGTRMLFVQGFAPVGWVQDTAITDRVLRIVGDNTGNAGGGGWGISGLQAATTVLGHQLNQGEIPSHTHNLYNVVTNVGGNVNFGNASTFIQLGSFTLTSDGGTGGNQSHDHPASTTVSGDGSWRPAYVNSMIAVKQ